jgi:hypothetical protein
MGWGLLSCGWWAAGRLRCCPWGRRGHGVLAPDVFGVGGTGGAGRGAHDWGSLDAVPAAGGRRRAAGRRHARTRYPGRQGFICPAAHRAGTTPDRHAPRRDGGGAMARRWSRPAPAASMRRVRGTPGSGVRFGIVREVDELPRCLGRAGRMWAMRYVLRGRYMAVINDAILTLLSRSIAPPADRICGYRGIPGACAPRRLPEARTAGAKRPRHRDAVTGPSSSDRSGHDISGPARS